MKPRSPSGVQVLGYKHIGLGLQFAGGILLFLGAGYALDRWLGTLPFGTVLGTLVGAVMSFLVVYRRIRADEAREREEARQQRQAKP